jgi:hypothetical protein
MSVGGARNVQPEKIRNDIVDGTYAAHATYFQRLLSLRANEIYADTKFLIGLFSQRRRLLITFREDNQARSPALIWEDLSTSLSQPVRPGVVNSEPPLGSA